MVDQDVNVTTEKTIFYIGRFGLPDTAPGIRVFNVSKVLNSLGYSVQFISAMGTRYGQEAEVIYDSHKYTFTNLCSSKNKVIHTLSNLRELLTAGKTYRHVKKRCCSEKPYAIILYNDLYPLTKKLLSFCKKNGILLLADVTEWYEKRKYKKLGDFIIPYLTNKRICKLDPKLDGIIAISGYLRDFYVSQGCDNIICVPPLFEVDESLPSSRHMYDDKQAVNLVYAGSPGSKDILIPVFDALELVNKESMNVRLDIAGIDEAQLQSMWKNIDFQHAGIFAHGRLSHEETLEIIKKADFGILFREDKRYAKAGYSTKFAECMANGVAMICNKIGGTDLDITDGINGFLTDTKEVNEIVALLYRLIATPDIQIRKIKETSRKYAFQRYSPISHIAQFEKFLSQRNIK